ncbi:MAG TPA: hypothetical protein PKL14_11265, partial [Holophaga sp.]|nr:hypothetical protein [Holophaga sp.]
ASQIKAEPGWEFMAPLSLQTLCVRHVPKGLSPKQVDAHNLAIADGVNGEGCAYLTTTVLKDRRVLRVSIGAETTERQHVEALWAALQREANTIKSTGGL